LEELGIKVLLPQAHEHFANAGALVDPDTDMVRIGRDMVTAALASAPKSIHAYAGSRARDLTLELGSMTFLAGCGAPNVTDLERGRRPGTLADFEDLMRLVQHFDVLHMLGPCIEPQDVDNRFRHYAVNRAQLTLSDKLPFVFARGTPQVEDGFEMLRLARGLSEEEFLASAHCYT
ncbi:trimethylamine methyltransferase, partial [Mesorhizobium sp. M7A.F.Ca.CA.001.08.2.1]